MGKTDVKWCETCQEWQFVEWGVDSEIREEPRFHITCQVCGTQQEAEPPQHFKSKVLPTGQEKLQL